MSRRIDKHPLAKEDLRSIAEYIARDNLDAALRFLDATDAAFEFLASMPGGGARREDLRADLHDTRSWPIRGFENYLIFYRPTDSGIEVIRVLHGARDIESIFEG